ncbi:HNH endonuclease signature motif containing protein [Type-E symbiont of Plautia stali]|uniref:HNH endonuclease signature motif containing protein n=1 Tax=Type-E symbiont of Plautia stali TaxID=1560357 RepID=UPI00073E842C|nr:HNH endonuclease signature motif containing protein [Type-E symbiont of Plautia stali]
MTQRYTPEQAERMKKRRCWVYVDGERFSSAAAANKHVGVNIFHAAWRADLISESGGEEMKIGDRTKSVRRGNHIVFLERRDDLSDKSVRDYQAARRKLLNAGWRSDELDEMENGELYTHYRSELELERLSVPHFSGSEKKYTRAEIRPAQGRFRREVMSNWENQCAITGTRLALEAAHIVSHASGGTASIENGICLAADLHTLLDSGHLLILEGITRLSDEAKNDLRYAALEGTVLRTSRVKVHFPTI